jgi:hypothetical protein
MALTLGASRARRAAPAQRAGDRPVRGRRPRQQNPKPHVAVRLDEAAVARGEAVRLRLSNEWRDATVSETYRMLVLVGIAAADAPEREGRLLKDATLVGAQHGPGGSKDNVPVRIDASARVRIEETQVKLSSEWRQATLSDVIRLFLLLGLERVEAVRGKNLREKLPQLIASLRARGRARGSSA